MKLFFTAEHCTACVRMYETAREAGFQTVSLDTDEGVELANKHSVRGLPTFLVLDEFGSVVWRHAGTIAKSELGVR